MTTDDEIKEEILELVVNEFEQDPASIALSGDGIVDKIRNKSPKYDRSDIEYNITRLDDDFAIDHTPTLGGIGTIQLNYRGIELYEQLSGKNVVSMTEIKKYWEN